MHIVIFREHGTLNMFTQYIGPFADWDAACEYLSELPALGICHNGENPGVKYIAELIVPDTLKP